MMDRELDRLRKEKDRIVNNTIHQLEQNKQILEDHLTQVRDEYSRVVEFSGQAGYVLDKIDREFQEKTRLSGSDTAFLFLCVALQCARQYLLTNDMFRITAVQGDKLMEETVGQFVPPSWQDVLFQSVPYDTIATGEHISNTGLVSYPHRKRTLKKL